MKENCKACLVPEIMSKIVTSRQLALAANANIVASVSPTQAAPYQLEAQKNTDDLRNAMRDLDQFVKSGKKCQSCES